MNMKLSRRDFIKGSLAGAAGAALTSIPGVAYADRTGILSEDKTYEEGQYSCLGREDTPGRPRFLSGTDRAAPKRAELRELPCLSPPGPAPRDLFR